MNRLKNKVAIVTGASKGIGAAIAEHYAIEGAKIVVNYASDKIGADKVVKAIIEKGGQALAVKADVSKTNEVLNLFEETLKNYGSLDILVNNAGIYPSAPIEEVTEHTFRKLFDINVLGSLLTIREAVKAFGPNGGVIINVSSEVSNSPMAGISEYSATKAALDAITISLSKEFSGRNIRINSLLPGGVKTEGTITAGITGSDLEKMLIEKTPFGRIGQPQDIAKVAVFLGSEEAGWINGQKIAASGGIYGF
ncbi:MAG: glucose 1-dehydrogenase [Bacteroidota bacterium]|nr:glucose 1-dehydrogenase [Bacteroidota bacterium]